MDETIRDGSLIFIYLDEKRQFLVEASAHAKLSTDLGNFDLKDLIGQPFGYVGKTHLGREFYCLKPSTSDLMLKVKRTTTVVYPKDLGLLLLETAVGPGARIIEIGTGSGALTLVLAKFVGSEGRVYTYDRRQEFSDNAKKNLERAGFHKTVEFFCCDVAQEGVSQDNVDAIFIDVPEPWEVIPKVKDALKGGHHLASWSPNVEQVKRTIDVLKENGFIRLKVSEINERELLVRQQGIRPKERGITHTAYLVRGQKILLNPK